jgi:phosphoribosylformylglycinamidine synthase
VAGLCNPGGNVLGLMPHPERACESLTGGEAGRRLLASLLG